MSDQRNTVSSDLPRYGRIPEWILFNRDVSATAVRVFAVLDRYSHMPLICPSRKKLAEQASCAVRTLDRALDELVGIGALTVRHRRNEKGDPTSNEYVLHWVRGSVKNDTTPLNNTTPRVKNDTTGSVKNDTQEIVSLKESELRESTSPAVTRPEPPGRRASNRLWNLCADVYGLTSNDPGMFAELAEADRAKEMRIAGRLLDKYDHTTVECAVSWWLSDPFNARRGLDMMEVERNVINRWLHAGRPATLTAVRGDKPSRAERQDAILSEHAAWAAQGGG